MSQTLSNPIKLPSSSGYPEGFVMESLPMSINGLDQEAMDALQAEAQVHMQKIAEIFQKNPGVWNWELRDEEQRHRRFLEDVCQGAKMRTQYRA